MARVPLGGKAARARAGPRAAPREAARMFYESAIYNCTSFSAGLWNAVCSDTLCAGVPETPADLKADMLRKYPDKTVFGPTVPYDYIVYYGTSLTPSQEFS